MAGPLHHAGLTAGSYASGRPQLKKEDVTMARRRPWGLLVAVLVLVALAASACGDDDAESPSVAPSDDSASVTATDDDQAPQEPAPEEPASEEPASEEPASEEPSDGEAEDFSDVQVAFLLNDVINDGAWNSRFAQAAADMEEAFPGLEITIVENVASGQEATNTFEDLALQGYDLLIGTNFFQEEVLAISDSYPDTVFLTWAGYTTTPNVGHYDGATEDGRYLDGLIAGSVTEGKIGYVAGFPIEEVNRALNAFMIGVREINPDATVEVIYVNSWYDPATEAQAAEALVNAGADILGHEVGSPAVATTAEERGVRLVGYTSDRRELAPNAWLTSFTFDWSAYFISQLQAVIDGTWKPALTYGGLAQDMIGNSPYGEGIDPDVIDLVEERRQAIRDGSLDFFAGPLVDNEGNVVVEAGETIPFEERTLCCLWLIEGIEGSVPG